MKETTLLALILSLLVVSGCAVSSQQLLGSPNFVAEYLPELLSLEKEANDVLEQLRMLAFVGISAEEFVDEMQGHFNTYWVYYHAANVFLSSGDRDRYVQAIGRAEHSLAKITDIIDELLDNFAGPEPIKPETLSL